MYCELLSVGNDIRKCLESVAMERWKKPNWAFYPIRYPFFFDVAFWEIENCNNCFMSDIFCCLCTMSAPSKLRLWFVHFLWFSFFTLIFRPGSSGGGWGFIRPEALDSCYSDTGTILQWHSVMHQWDINATKTWNFSWLVRPDFKNCLWLSKYVVHFFHTIFSHTCWIKSLKNRKIYDLS